MGVLGLRGGVELVCWALWVWEGERWGGFSVLERGGEGSGVEGGEGEGKVYGDFG